VEECQGQTQPALSLETLREEYRRGALDESRCDTSPIAQFRRWIEQARTAGLREPNAMTLSTATPEGKPSGRIVLLKEVSAEGFIFYTSYLSRKGQEIECNPFAALTFYWGELERQVRIEGSVTQVPRTRSERYFRSRPKGSRLGALASRQSQVVASRSPLEEKLKELQNFYSGTDDIPVPDWWGGYCVRPEVIEFWQGRENRLHDRIRYRREGEYSWTRERLSP
jgi:pyridoxamine 5'-phosphate oxidase